MRIVPILAAVATLTGTAVAQTGPVVARIDVKPAELNLEVGATARISATAYDSAGHVVAVPMQYFSTARRSAEVDSTGLVLAHQGGEYKIMAIALGARRMARGVVTVVISPPALSKIDITGGPARYYAGTSTRHHAVVSDKAGAIRPDQTIRWKSESPSVVAVDQFGDVTGLKPGTAVLTAATGSLAGSRRITVVANPARSLDLQASAERVRTGDVVHFAVTARGVRGDVVSDLPITFSVKSNVEDTVIASEPPAQVEQDGRFVAQRAGDYTVIASAGSLVASKTIAVDHRFTSIRIADLAVTPHGSKLVVTTLDSRYAAPTLEGIGGDPGTIDIIDLTRLVKVATVEIGKQAGGIAVLPRVPPSR